jgi:NADH-quinone oxidoreductase subunit M
MITLTLILLPLLAALVTFAVGGENAKRIAFVGALANLAVLLFAWSQFSLDSESPLVQFPFSAEWLPIANIKFAVGMDGISLLLVLLTNLLVPVIILSTFHHNYKNPVAFYSLILIMQTGLIGVFTAQDAFIFYFFWEVALIPIYFIAAVWGGERRIQVTLKFFIYTVFGSLFMLLALLYLYFRTEGVHSSALNDIYSLKGILSPTEQTCIFWALFLAFAIKMPVFPFHSWQPDTYTESPTPATMLLSGIMLKMGIYGAVRWLIPIVPTALDYWKFTVIILSIIGILYGSIIALRQKDIKRLLAYSSFAHVGLMAAGVFTGNFEGVQGAVIQMLAHGINVVGLFLIIEAIDSRIGVRDLEYLGGITQKAPFLTVLFAILLLGSVALPLTNGFIGEFMLLLGVFKYNNWFGVVAGITIILGAAYMLRMFQGTMFGTQSNYTKNMTDLNTTEKLALLPLVVMVFWVGLYPATFTKVIEPSVQQIITILK